MTNKIVHLDSYVRMRETEKQNEFLIRQNTTLSKQILEYVDLTQKMQKEIIYLKEILKDLEIDIKNE